MKIKNLRESQDGIEMLKAASLLKVDPRKIVEVRVKCVEMVSPSITRDLPLKWLNIAKDFSEGLGDDEEFLELWGKHIYVIWDLAAPEKYPENGGDVCLTDANRYACEAVAHVCGVPWNWYASWATAMNTLWALMELKEENGGRFVPFQESKVEKQFRKELADICRASRLLD